MERLLRGDARKMKYAVNLPNFDVHADCRLLADLARDAEMAGWDGFFIWDHLRFTDEELAISDPWIALAAIALRTERIRIGTLVTPLPRRRPWIVARQAATLDQLSGGRLILGVGIGDPADVEYGTFGEETDARHRGQLLDEGLAILAGLWSGRPFRHDGAAFQIEETTFLPTPVQRPRIPIWVGGTWPNRAPMRRAARWDGAFPLGAAGGLSPEAVDEVRAFLENQRTGDAPFDLVVSVETPGDDREGAAAIVRPFAEAGATWCVEDLSMWRFDGDIGMPWPADAIRARIRQGPASLR